MPERKSAADGGYAEEGPSKGTAAYERQGAGSVSDNAIRESSLRHEATDQDLRFLARAQHWFADGTSSVVHAEYVQLYSLRAHREGASYLCAYAPLPGKSRGCTIKCLPYFSHERF